MRRSTFAGCHPLVSAAYFILVLAVTMTVQHPAFLGVSLVCAAVCGVRLAGSRAVRGTLRFLVPGCIAAAVLFPAFTHQGVTILTYLPGGNPLTLESIVCGLTGAAALAAAVLWFVSVTAVMTSDRIMYLLGRVIPSLSLMLSLALRFVPRFSSQFDAVAQAQQCAGRSIHGGGMLNRVRNWAAVFSVLVTWSLESAIDTADSMKGRGWGLPGRTAFSIFVLESRDRALLAFFGACGLFLLGGALAGGCRWRCFPSIKSVAAGPVPAALLLCFLSLCLTPVWLEAAENRAKSGERRRLRGMSPD